MKLDFSSHVYLRNRTHAYLKVQDNPNGSGSFLTMETGKIEITTVGKEENTYVVHMDGVNWPLAIYPYDFMKALEKFESSTLDRSAKAEAVMKALRTGGPLPHISGRRIKKKKTRTAQKKPSPTGQEITLAEICEELGTTPGEARKRLRGKVEKPGSRWVWSSRESASAVFEVLSEKT